MSYLESNIHIRSMFVNLEDVNLEPHAWMLDYWDQLRGSRFAPTWQEIALHEFPTSIIPLVNVTDISPEPLTSVYRFWGTGLNTATGRDYTGKSPTEVPPKKQRLSARGGCGRLVNERTPHCEVKRFETLNGYRGRAVILRLPCSTDGENVSQGIALYAFEHVDPTASLSDFCYEIYGPLRDQPANLTT